MDLAFKDEYWTETGRFCLYFERDLVKFLNQIPQNLDLLKAYKIPQNPFLFPSLYEYEWVTCDIVNI